MSAPQSMQDVQQAIARIDAIIHQLEVLRRDLNAVPTDSPAKSRTQALFGAAGKGTRDEYDLNLDWTRFAEW